MIDAPSDLQSEAAVLGFLLANAETDLAIPLTPEHFAEPVHGAIYRTLAHLRGTVPFLLPAVADALAAELADVGGPAYLTRLLDPRATHEGAAAAFGHFVVEAWHRRRLVQIAFHMQAVATEVAVAAADQFQSPPAAEQHEYLRARLTNLLALVEGAGE